MMRLYYDDPALLTFDATVVACEPTAAGYRIALDRSAFYPTSGGQLHDSSGSCGPQVRCYRCPK